LAVRIKSVESGSIADAAGILAGELLCSINENGISDVLDYRYYSADEKLILTIESPEGRKRRVRIRNPEYAPLGLEFETYLMDEKRSCTNKCVFCFIDQLPKGMRDSLYFKDDDMRLSFLMGNYITLTNLPDEDIKKIKKLRISPLNISVHTTNPDIRKKMINNKYAGNCLKIMKELGAAGITMNCQIVVCPGINDGEELRKTLCDLIPMYPEVNSISVVPVGLTAHRNGLYPLKPVDKITACNIIGIVETLGKMALDGYGSRVAYASDELYIKAGLPMPTYEHYEDFPQLENGVGMISLLQSEFEDEYSRLENGIPAPQSFSLATGTAAAPFISELVDKLKGKCPGLSCAVYPTVNNFFGETVDVSGLVTGSDLIGALKGKSLGARLLIPVNMLRYDGRVFLDDLTLEDVGKELNTVLVPVKNNGCALIDAMLDRH
jgi:putative radical SAM enzyme (TIGR03279 family)